MNGEKDEFRDREAVKLDRLELALKASNEGIWDWWTDRPEIYYSRRILEFLECGKLNAPHLFLEPFDSIHSDDRERFGKSVAQALATGGPETLAIDARVRTGSGEWRWLRIRGTVVRHTDGRTYRIAGSMIDISMRKRAEAQLEDERFLLRQLIDNMPLQVYFKDRLSRFVMANQRMARWFGFESSDDLVGKHDRDFFDELHASSAEEDERTIMRTQEPVTGKLERETWSKGAETWVVTSKFPWLDSKGRLKGTFGVSSDVTELVLAQRSATELAEELAEQNRVYEEELRLAREIQQALSPQVGGMLSSGAGSVTVGSRYIPISGLAGDFFEVIQIRPDAIGLLIVDVMGHGVRSALIVAVMRGLLEKLRHQADDPGALLEGLNDGLTSLLQRAGVSMFATAFYGVADFANGTFDFTCAGHPGPIALGGGTVRQIAAGRSEKGPALGLFAEADFPVTSLPLSEIERLILFTDGILEAEDREGRPFFEEKLIEVIRDTAEYELEETLDRILSRVLKYCETLQFDDDVCLLGADISA